MVITRQQVDQPSPLIQGQIEGQTRTNCKARIPFYKVPTTSKKNPSKSFLEDIFYFNIKKMLPKEDFGFFISCWDLEGGNSGEKASLEICLRSCDRMTALQYALEPSFGKHFEIHSRFGK